MTDIFTSLLGMSFQASIVIAVVLCLRFLFEKLHISKKYIMLLWIVPFVCLIVPWKISSPIGFWNNAPSEYENVIKEATWLKSDLGVVLSQDQTANMSGNQISDNHAGADKQVNADKQDNVGNQEGSGRLQNSANQESAESVNSGAGVTVDANVQANETTDNESTVSTQKELGAETIIMSIAILWGIGVFALGLYSTISYERLKKQLCKRIPIRERVYFVDDVPVPMVVGVFNPKIYIPTGIEKEHLEYVVAHEETHIKRKDTLTKGVAYVVTCLHWFNPLVWLAYILMIKDMEMTCDEETILRLGEAKKKEYATALLQLATGKRNVFAVPLAFGEGSTKGRIVNVLKYKKTKTILAVAALVISVVVALVFLTKGEDVLAGKGDGTKQTEDIQITEKDGETEATENTEETEEIEETEAGDKGDTEIALTPPEEGGTAGVWLKKYYYEEGGWSRLFADYDGTKIQRIEYSGYSSYSPSLRGEIVYYNAEEGEDIQNILKKMATYMYDPLMKEEEGRSYTITKYMLEDSPIIQVRDDAWIVEYINGYYAYEGVDVVSMDVALENETSKDGMVSFMRQGSEDVFKYILLKEGNVYRLEKYSHMLPTYDVEDKGDRKVVYEMGMEEEELSPLQKVIFNIEPFYGKRTFSDTDPRAWYMVEECDGFGDYRDDTSNYFYVIDMDQDGKEEVCVSYRGLILILHEQEGSVYGYNHSMRSFNPPYKDGTFRSSGGASYGEFCGKVWFGKNIFSYETITSTTYDTDGTVHYYKDGASYSNGIEITEEEYNEIMSEYELEEAEKYDFTIENILKYVP